MVNTKPDDVTSLFVMFRRALLIILDIFLHCVSDVIRRF